MANTSNVDEEGWVDCSQAKKEKPICSYGEKCYRRNPQHFDEYEHPHLDKLLKNMYREPLNVPNNYTPKTSNLTLMEQLEIMKHHKPWLCKDKDRPSGSKLSPKPGSTKGESSEEIEKKSSLPEKVGRTIHNEKKPVPRESLIASVPLNAREENREEIKKRLINQKQAENYRVVACDLSKYKVADKLKIASPYNIFLTVITDSKPTHTEMLSISMPELLDPSLGDLESSLQINFMVEFGWLLAQYFVMGHRNKPLTLIYGQIDETLDSRFAHFLTHAKVVPPSSFGSHHTKMMMFSYKDGSMRVVVSTANMVESDWDNRTQGLWLSPSCPPLPEYSDTASGDSVTGFKTDLLRYLSEYKLPELQPWVSKVKKTDFSSVRVCFLSSVPGNHPPERQNWGHRALAKLLTKHATVPDENKYPVIVQVSSIGSLGPNPESWLMGDMLTAFCSGKKTGVPSKPNLHFIYPSFSNVAVSHDGLLGGGCLPYTNKTHLKQEWVTTYMCQWKSDKRYRTKAVPHIKTYCRVSRDLSKLSYFVLTSANMSKAAWGNRAKNGNLNILSYEAGVLFLPEFLIAQDHFPLKESEDNPAPIFPMPYDLPVTHYEFSDVPWFIENLSQ